MNRSFAWLRLVLALSVALALAGCVNHRKSADAAAKAGQWKAAEAHYREALRKKPDDKDLAKKHAEAKVKAFEQAMAQAKTCNDSKQWPCAMGEADYAASLEPANAEAKALSVSVHKSYALDDLAKARTGVTGDAAWGLDMVDHARGLSTDAEVVREIQTVTAALVNAIIQQAADLRGQAAAAGSGALPIYDRAIVLLERGAKADMRCNQVLAEVRGERTRWVDAEYERFAKQGDEGLVRNQWPVAHASYTNAEALRAGGRGQSGAAYAKLVMDGEGAVGRRDWRAAADHYKRAAGLPQDNLTRKFAASQIDKVEVRAYRFRLASLLVNPLGPDGRPWADGAANARNVPTPPSSSSRGQDFRNQLKGYSQRVPPVARPNLVVDVTLPDGRVLRSSPKNDVWATFDAWFVVNSNQLDTRPVLVRVKHVEKNGTEKDLGTVNVPLGTLVSGLAPPPTGPIIWMDFMTDVPQTIADGAFGGFASMVPGRANEATDGSSPSSAAAVGWRLARVEASVRGTDVKGGSPDLRVEIEQSGRLVYRSPEIKGSADGSWAPENVYIFAAPQEQLIVRLLDADPSGGNPMVIGGAVPAPGDRLPTLESKTPQGSLARLVFERRVSSP